ncbi:CBS domain-containing protein [Histidinibacterium aquaticum]|uniref:CBS domain-containing protein n=1 Tax=Histidinibacterium aquaticum TaxID=2613962 RepID=A0A5J5GMZ7_9RHOB|nr:CBS domain-containing protein [Histidinibacterium aquaticum]KAA9009417.1 CBS domain-containing protein [Histidinibacterium aquaticum]
MRYRPSIDRYMTREPVTLSPEMELTRATGLFVSRGISGAPVTDDAGRILGMLTVKDCFRAILHASYHQDLGGTVSDYMTAPVETLEADLDIVAAARRFMDQPYRRFPVMSEGRLVGILTRKDLLKGLHDEFSE